MSSNLSCSLPDPMAQILRKSMDLTPMGPCHLIQKPNSCALAFRNARCTRRDTPFFMPHVAGANLLVAMTKLLQRLQTLT